LPIQTTKFATISFQRALVPPLWKRFRHPCRVPRENLREELPECGVDGRLPLAVKSLYAYSEVLVRKVGAKSQPLIVGSFIANVLWLLIRIENIKTPLLLNSIVSFL